LHLLFWLSLLPFATGWMGENHFAPVPSALYGSVLLCAAVAYLLLQHAIIVTQGTGSILRRAIGKDWKGRSSPVVYVVAIALTTVRPWMGQALYLAVALVWLVPDRRIERALADGAT
jgi:uncharacterized membrane protein